MGDLSTFDHLKGRPDPSESPLSESALNVAGARADLEHQMLV